MTINLEKETAKSVDAKKVATDDSANLNEMSDVALNKLTKAKIIELAKTRELNNLKVIAELRETIKRQASRFKTYADEMRSKIEASDNIIEDLNNAISSLKSMSADDSLEAQILRNEVKELESLVSGLIFTVVSLVCFLVIALVAFVVK